MTMVTIAHSPSSPFNVLIYHKKLWSVTMVTIIFPLLSFERKKGGSIGAGNGAYTPRGGNVMGRQSIVTIVTIVTHQKCPPNSGCAEMTDERVRVAISEGEKQ